LVTAAVLLLALSAPPASAGQDASPFEARFAGEFAVTEDVGGSGIFVVEEVGSGAEAALGEFTYTGSVFQSQARAPAGCGGGSSTGVDGAAVLSFADGDLRLQRTAGTSCFAFPTIHVEEQWVIASGTGNYVGATGKLSRELDGNVRLGTAVGTLSGSIRLK
jgi:hypothetical protein